MDHNTKVYLAVLFPVIFVGAVLIVLFLWYHGLRELCHDDTVSSNEHEGVWWTGLQHARDAEVAGGNAAERATEMTNHPSEQSSQTTLRAPQQGDKETDTESWAKLDAYHGFGHNRYGEECGGDGSEVVPDDRHLLEKRT